MPPAEPQAVTPRLLEGWPLPEPSGGGKHQRGTVVVVGGAVSTPGAVLLAGLAALRVGAGRLKVVTVEPTAVSLGTAIPEAMVVGLPTGSTGSLHPGCAAQVCDEVQQAQAVVIGPGLLDKDDVATLLETLLPALPDDVSVVLDAVALSALALVPKAAVPLRGRLVLTPNAGEAAALLDGDERTGCDAALAIAQRYGGAVAAPGWVADADGRTWSDESGGIGLGTSGSGDVQAGAVGGLLARGAEPPQAAVFGQYLHGAAGDRLAPRVGRLGFLAREVLDELPAVLSRLHA